MTTIDNNINSQFVFSDSDDEKCKECDDKHEEYNVEDVRNFFVKECHPGWQTFQTGSRCEGFTLSYGMFIRLDVDKINFNEMIIKEGLKTKFGPQDQCRIMRQEFSNPDVNYIEPLCDSLHYKYPELNFYALPCCWGEQTKLDVFVGFNIYPLLWTKRRYIVKKIH